MVLASQKRRRWRLNQLFFNWIHVKYISEKDQFRWHFEAINFLCEDLKSRVGKLNSFEKAELTASLYPLSIEPVKKIVEQMFTNSSMEENEPITAKFYLLTDLFIIVYFIYCYFIYVLYILFCIIYLIYICIICIKFLLESVLYFFSVFL